MRPSSNVSSGFSLRVRVYYEDTDAGGIVYYANYLRFMERARTEWLRSLGAGHRELAESARIGFVVREVHLQYLGPARLDDELLVDVVPVEVRRASMRLRQSVTRPADQLLLVTGSVRIAALGGSTGRPIALPRALYDQLTRDD